MRWHRGGFRYYWCWKSRSLGGRPQIETDLRALIRRMSVENQLWGAPRIHGELLKLGFEVAQSSVAKYMVKRRGPPSQGWRTFLRNHAPDIAAMDLFIAPTIGFDLLYAFVIVRLDPETSSSMTSQTHEPDGRMDCASNNGGISLGRCPQYSIPKSECNAPAAIVTRRLRHGHPGQAYCTSLAWPMGLPNG